MALEVKPLKWFYLILRATYPDLKVGENERGILQEAQENEKLLTCYEERREKKLIDEIFPYLV
jgi:hypothetical protein